MWDKTAQENHKKNKRAAKTTRKTAYKGTWGPNVVRTLHPGFGHEVSAEIIEQGLDKYVAEARMNGYQVLHREPGNVLLWRDGKPNDSVQALAIGGWIGAAMSGPTSRVRVQLWADRNGAIYATDITDTIRRR